MMFTNTPLLQVLVRIKVTEELTARGKSPKIISHAPCWVFVKRIPGTQREQSGFGGWRVAARLQDKSTPAGEGAEVAWQTPGEQQLKKLAEAWSLQKASIKADTLTMQGRIANIILR